MTQSILLHADEVINDSDIDAQSSIAPWYVGASQRQPGGTAPSISLRQPDAGVI